MSFYNPFINDDEFEESSEDIVGELDVINDAPKEKELRWNIKKYTSLSTYGCHYAPIFTFLGVRWSLQYNPSRGCRNNGMLSLTMDKMGLTYNVLCTFGIKKPDGSLFGSVSFKHLFCVENPKLVAENFFITPDLWHFHSQMTPSETLFVTCNLKQLPHPMKLTELNLLSEKMKSILHGGEFCDVILQVKGKKFNAHKIILAARSSVFDCYFKHKTLENSNNVISIPDCDPDSFPQFLEYLYSGELEDISFRNALQLYNTADKYDVQELKTYCVEYMEYNLNIEYFYDVLSLAEVHDDTNLFAAAQDFFNRNLSEIFSTDQWQNLLKTNSDLVNKLLMEMSSDVQVVSKRRRL